jgi:hypothetical protein
LLGVLALGVLALAVLGACSTQAPTSATTPSGQARATATRTQAPSATAAAGECPAAWQGFPPESASIIGGVVLLPPHTRVILVDSVPGAADANLCTTGMAATQIDQFMQMNLSQKGWRYDTEAEQWLNGPALALTYRVADPLSWTVDCQCGGI